MDRDYLESPATAEHRKQLVDDNADTGSVERELRHRTFRFAAHDLD